MVSVLFIAFIRIRNYKVRILYFCYKILQTFRKKTSFSERKNEPLTCAKIVSSQTLFYPIHIRLRAKKGPAPPPPREFCRHTLS